MIPRSPVFIRYEPASLAACKGCQDVFRDVGFPHDVHAGLQQLGAKRRDLVRGPEIREEEGTPRAEQPCDLGQEGGQRPVAVRRLDVHDGVEAPVREREALRVGVLEGQRRHAVDLAAEEDRLVGEVHGRHRARAHVARQEGAPASPPAAHLEGVQAVEGEGAGHVGVELDRAAVRLILLLEAQPLGIDTRGHEAVVHEGPLPVGVALREELVDPVGESPAQPGKLANGQGIQRVDHRHSSACEV